MLRRLVRSYYRLRYFPRHIFEAFNAVLQAIAGLHRHEHEVVTRLMSAHEERLARIHEEIASFCDDAIRAMMAESARIACIETRLQSLQHGLQRLENGAADTQGRLAALQQSLQSADPQAAGPLRVEALEELMQGQAAKMDHIEALVIGQARSLPAQAKAAAAANGQDQLAQNDGRLSHG